MLLHPRDGARDHDGLRARFATPIPHEPGAREGRAPTSTGIAKQSNLRWAPESRSG